MFLAKEGVYLEYDLQSNYIGERVSTGELAFIPAERLWGDFDEARKLSSIPGGVEWGIVSLCKWGVLQKMFYSNPNYLGDESDMYVCHLYNNSTGDLVANYFDGSTFDFDNVRGKFVIPTYIEDCRFNISETYNTSLVYRTLKDLLGYCDLHNISDVFIVGGTDEGTISSSYVIQNSEANKHIGVTEGSYTLLCIESGITLLDELKLPVTSNSGVYYDTDSVAYADEVVD